MTETVVAMKLPVDESLRIRTNWKVSLSAMSFCGG